MSLVEMFNSLRMQIKEDSVSSLKQMEENITKTITDKIEDKFSKFESNIQQIQNKQEEHEKKLDNIERKLRQKNLIFFGISEEEKSYSELEEIMIQIINLNMEVEIDRRDLEFVGRMGKKGTKPRPVRLTLTTFGKKLAIFQRKSSLDGTGTYIKEDFPPNILEKRKVLISQLQEYREKGIPAILKYDRLIVKEKAVIQNTNKKRSLPESPPEKNTSSTQKLSGKSEQFNKILKTNTTTNFPRTNKNAKIDKPTQGSSIASFLTKTPQNERQNATPPTHSKQ